MNKSYIVFDTETTGLNPLNGDRVIEIGCVEIIDNQFTERKFHEYVNPECLISEESFNIHKISNDFVANKGKFNQIANSLRKYFDHKTNEREVVLIGHNITFDIRFLNSEFEKSGIDFNLNDFKTIDTVLISKIKWPGEMANLDAFCQRCGTDISQREKDGHGALLDATLLAKAILDIGMNEIERLLIDDLDFDINILNKKLDSPLSDRGFLFD